MKARKPDGTRWFTATTAELMDRWLVDPELIGWLGRTVELATLELSRRETVALIDALMAQIAGPDPEAVQRQLARQLSWAKAQAAELRNRLAKRRGLN
jgi:hypothetical protein